MKIAIAGFGAEGKANFAYYQAQGGHEITVVDEREQLANLPESIPALLGSGSFTRLQDFDLVVRETYINPIAIQTNGSIWSATNEFFARCPAQIIGVTGTKGKSTTCHLIAAILRAAGKTVHIISSAATPVLKELAIIKPGDIVVYELNSFELYDLEKSPHVAVILPIEPDHQTIYVDMKAYVRAMATIRLHQTMTDTCFYHPDNQYTQQIIDMRGDQSTDDFKHRDWRWRAYRYALNESRDPSLAFTYIEQNIFCIRRPGIEKISTIPTNILEIPGIYNMQNACAAIDVALAYEVSDEAIAQGLSSFAGLPHRLQFIRELDGVSFYDDSSGSTPGSSIAVMQSFTTPKIMIIGGATKGANYEEMARVASSSNVRAVVAIGDEASTIEAAMRDRNVVTFNVGNDITMSSIVDVALSQAQTGDTVILSPACSALGMFKSYTDRGEQFTNAVRAL